jgi:hypothetical protein
MGKREDRREVGGSKTQELRRIEALVGRKELGQARMAQMAEEPVEEQTE